MLVSQAALEADAEEDAEAAEERMRLLRENAALRKLARQLYQRLENGGALLMPIGSIIGGSNCNGGRTTIMAHGK